MKIPQADDVTKIIDLPLAIADKVNTRKLIAQRYKFDERQSNYYLEATEILGLATRRMKRYLLTGDGERYIMMDVPQRNLMLIRKMVMVPIINRIIAELLACEDKTLEKKDLERIIGESAKVGGSTVSRRAQTIVSWFRWLGEETGVFYTGADFVKLKIAEPTVPEK